MSDENECNISSEISHSFIPTTVSKRLLNEKNVVSKFQFFVPSAKSSDEKVKNPEKDEDGDYIVARKKVSTNFKDNIILEHSISSQLKFVGLQIWRAALLLADFIIHSNNLFKNKKVLELGSGVGLTGVVGGMFAKQVICTDLNIGNLLKLLESNFELNKRLVQGEIMVDELNFFHFDPSDIRNHKINSVDIVLAADVIYDNDITEAFVNTIIKIFSHPPKKTLYLSLEKRYVFTLSDLDTVAPCFEHFKSCLASAESKFPFPKWKVSEIPIDFPQYFEYERTKELILFEIKVL